mgnify:FL=1
MNNEEKFYDLLEKIYFELQDTKKDIGSVRTELKEDIGSVKTELKKDIGSVRTELKEDIGSVRTDLNDFREETNTRFDKLEEKLDLIESNNADRHLTINGDLKKVKTDLSKIEIVTADNWGDIARLKAIRRKKVK